MSRRRIMKSVGEAVRFIFYSALAGAVIAAFIYVLLEVLEP